MAGTLAMLCSRNRVKVEEELSGWRRCLLVSGFWGQFTLNHIDTLLAASGCDRGVAGKGKCSWSWPRDSGCWDSTVLLSRLVRSLYLFSKNPLIYQGTFSRQRSSLPNPHVRTLPLLISPIT